MRITGTWQQVLFTAALLLVSVRSDAAPTASCAKPEWPQEARRYELEGTTTLSFVVGPDGKPVSAKVEKSSGWRILDKASLIGLSRCVFAKSEAEAPAKPTQFVWRLNGESMLHPSMVEGSCPASEQFQTFKSLDKSPSDANGILLRMLVKPDGTPWNVKAEATGLSPEVLNAAAEFVQSCRFAVDPEAKGKRTDTTYGKLLLKN
ncbi:energy transducer TonB [Oxalobacteraceae bacterium OTU3CINTB1]|nr:energy transducer TonB [Oxalobacteraceae bacterium OTU3CINTB1]